MTNFSIVPQSIIDSLLSTHPEIISDIVSASSVPRVSILFISENEYFAFDARLNHDPMQRFQHSKWNEGISGLAILKNTTTSWPDSPETELVRLAAEPESKLEIATPIRFEGLPTGVILATFLGSDIPAISEKKRQIAELEFQAERVSALVDIKARDEPLRLKVRTILRSIIPATESKRGYVAIKNEDGSITYVTDKDDDEDVFLRLNLSEGLTGRALREQTDIVLDNVWEDDDYVPSDPEINSELLFVLDLSEIGAAVLNLEANPPAHFDAKRRERARSAVEELEPIVSEFLQLRRPSAFDQEIVLGFIEEVEANISNKGLISLSELNDFLLSIVRRNLQKLFPAESLIEWDGRRGLEPPRELSALKWTNSIERGVLEREEDTKWIVFAPFRRDGQVSRIFAFSSSSPRSIRDARTMRSICRFAELSFHDHSSRILEENFRRLIEDVIQPSDEDINLQRALHKMCEICQIDAMTMFGIHLSGRENRLVPVATTSPNLQAKDGQNEYYLIDAEDGLTGYVAWSKRPLILQNVNNKDERKRIGEDFNPIWKKKIAEHRDEDIQSFIAFPLLDPKTSNLYGVLRGHRLHRNAQAPFSENDIQRVRLFSKLVPLVFSRLLDLRF